MCHDILWCFHVFHMLQDLEQLIDLTYIYIYISAAAQNIRINLSVSFDQYRDKYASFKTKNRKVYFLCTSQKYT